MPDRVASLGRDFERLFGSKPSAIVKAPGRVDLMGSHTDYNDGFVLPVAVNLDTVAVGRLRDDDVISVYSANFGKTVEFGLDCVAHDEAEPWSNYARGVVVCLQDAGVELRGANIALHGTVPIGSGMSSSASIEIAVGFLLQTLVGFEMSGPELARIGQKAENKFVGVNTGLMDQFTSRLAKKDHALFLDCRTLAYSYVPLDTSDVKIVVCDTMKRRGLVGSEYDLRRSQCEEAARMFAQWLPNVKALRDVSSADFEEHGEKLPDVVRKRAQHIVYENERVLASREALDAGDFEKFASLMDESHDSARDLYELSCPELDAMAEVARAAPGSLCNRLAGAGFGGCSVSLVRDESVDEFVDVVREQHEARTGLATELYVCTAE
ncbi:MAG: galactokinase, partial [Armatimonadetes bacterium RBG_16_58_9]